MLLCRARRPRVLLLGLMASVSASWSLANDPPGPKRPFQRHRPPPAGQDRPRGAKLEPSSPEGDLELPAEGEVDPWLGRPFGPSDEEVQRVMQFVQERFPERFRDLKTLQEDKPGLFRLRLGEMFPRLRRMMQMHEDNPEMAEKILQDERLGLQIRATTERYFDVEDAVRREAIRGEIQTLVAQQIDVRQQLRESEIKRMERRLQALREQVQRDARMRDERLHRTMEELGVIGD